MHIVITGAGSFIGTALTQLLVQHAKLGERPITRLTRTDLHLPPLNPSAAWVKDVEGDLCSVETQQHLFDEPVDYVFHLAGITSRRAEEDLKLSLDVNVKATLALLESLRQRSYVPAFIFTSSIGVFGTPLPTQVNDQTPIQPTLSYGTHKRIVELLIADYSRLGHIDGRTVRLSGVIARPPLAVSALSTFTSDLIRHLAAGQPYICPVSEHSTNWLISLPCCVEQLLHAALTPATSWPASRVVTLPALRVTTRQLVEGMMQRYGEHCQDLISWQPNPQLEAQFGRWPPLETQLADQLGFRHDQNVDTLIQRAL